MELLIKAPTDQMSSLSHEQSLIRESPTLLLLLLLLLSHLSCV